MAVAGAAEFPDHFSAVAGAYAAFRPRYPAALFDFLAGCAPRHDLAWDCATGNGQAATDLAGRFARVIATDASGEQIAAATPIRGVEYRVAPAERSGLPDACADLVTVAQALHWFDRDAFFAEVQRVLVPGGVVAAWCYVRLEIAPSIDRIVDRFYRETVGPFWPAERRWVEDGYRSLTVPFAAIAAPPFAIERAFTLADLGGYLGTWSATRGFIQQQGVDPVPALLAELRESWGPPEQTRLARWPLGLRVGRR